METGSRDVCKARPSLPSASFNFLPFISPSTRAAQILTVKTTLTASFRFSPFFAPFFRRASTALFDERRERSRFVRFCPCILYAYFPALKAASRRISPTRYSGTTSSEERILSLDSALAVVQFKKDGVAYERNYFISYPNNVMAIRFK
ncbi:MAG: glycoside hydrolase N-terminal domain-containing protein, partial [Thermoguttaceae bacterium]|nr:glycoside hydrolase N-terminal domain-containing protein [Thermoguttaceae bacterium]